MAKIVGVKFKNAGKVYYFDPRGDLFRDGDGVIVETAKGLEYGTVAGGGVKDVSDEEVVQPLKPVVRRATAKDEESRKRFIEKRGETMKTLRELIKSSGLEMKLVDCEYSFDGSKLFVYFSAENRVDFRELVHTINVTLKTRVDLRQIGIRDEAKMLGGFAPCGRPCCCSAFLQDFKKVSIKMAKTQGLSLNPGKISGLCGRLMCCLEYENDYYADVSKQMPKIGSQVETEDGVGTVVSNNMLKLITRVKFPNPDGTDVYRDYETATMKAKKKEAAPDPMDLPVESAEAAIEDLAAVETVEEGQETERKEKPRHGHRHGDKHRGNPQNGNPQGEGREDRREKNHGDHRKKHRENREKREGGHGNNGNGNSGNNAQGENNGNAERPIEGKKHREGRPNREGQGDSRAEHTREGQREGQNPEHREHREHRERRGDRNRHHRPHRQGENGGERKDRPEKAPQAPQEKEN